MRPTRTAPRGPSQGISLTRQGGGGADDGEDVRIVFSVRAQDDALDLDFVEPAFGKEGANGAVGQAAGEDFLFGGAAFALEITARELAGGGRFLAVIHRQREEFLAGFGLAGGHGGDEDDGFAELDGDGAVGLFGQFAGFDVNLTGAELGRYFFWHNSSGSFQPADLEELQSRPVPRPAARALIEISQVSGIMVNAGYN